MRRVFAATLLLCACGVWKSDPERILAGAGLPEGAIPDGPPRTSWQEGTAPAEATQAFIAPSGTDVTAHFEAACDAMGWPVAGPDDLGGARGDWRCMDPDPARPAALEIGRCPKSSACTHWVTAWVFH